MFSPQQTTLSTEMQTGYSLLKTCKNTSEFYVLRQGGFPGAQTACSTSTTSLRIWQPSQQAQDLCIICQLLLIAKYMNLKFMSCRSVGYTANTLLS